jgi:hypothetical protein
MVSSSASRTVAMLHAAITSVEAKRFSGVGLPHTVASDAPTSGFQGSTASRPFARSARAPIGTGQDGRGSSPHLSKPWPNRCLKRKLPILRSPCNGSEFSVELGKNLAYRNVGGIWRHSASLSSTD